MEDKNTAEGLKRVIGINGFTATIINNTIGAGIYVLPAIVSMQMGPAGILGYVFCGAMLVTIMLCYMEIGSKVSATGGSYIYVETAFGPFAGFVINWLFFFGWGILGSASIMNALADSLAVLFPVFSDPVIRAVLFFVLLGLMVWINIRGAKESMRSLQYITVIKIIPIIGIIIFGFSHIKMSNLYWQHLPSIKTSGETVLVLFFAFAGFETSLSVSGEIKNPKRTIPLGILLGAVLVFVFYTLIQIVTQGVLGAQMGQFKSAPLAAVANHIVGPIGATILLIAAIISCLGTTGGDVLATPRLLFAGAKDGLFPKVLGKVHPQFATPFVAVISYASLIFLLSVSGGFKQLAVLASGCLLLIYLGVVLATLKLRKKAQPSTEKTFKVPGGFIIPFIAIATIIWLLFNLNRKEVTSISIFLAVICIIYFLMKLFKKKTVLDGAE